MKKFLNILMLTAAALMLFGCTPSTIRESGSTEDFPDGVVIEKDTTAAMTLPETSKYTIPADAETGENGGPGAMETTAVDRSYYPEDKQHGESVEENGTMIIIYVPGSNGITSVFDYVDTCDADSVIQAMKNNNALTDDIDVISFEKSDDGRNAKLEISDATAVYAAASDKEVVAAVANTFIDNFNLDEIDITAAGEDYGYMGFSQEYDAKKSTK